ncbi:receptor-like protein EIX2 [Lotus japonicus]|uniref:receptor-like protein EIX2 n=1 Tax=Lotus japonicus TaxID=34305 RepID=UPI00258AC4A6|nr:receptor-like protein EIX2 [Lotus japonicus]
MVSTETYLKALRAEALDCDLYYSYQTQVTTPDRIRSLVSRLLTGDLDPQLKASLLTFLERTEEMWELHRRRLEVNMLIWGLEVSAAEHRDAETGTMDEIEAELASLLAIREGLDRDLRAVHLRYNAMREPLPGPCLLGASSTRPDPSSPTPCQRVAWSLPDQNANDLEWVSHLSNLRFLDMSFVNLSQVVDWLSSINKISSLSELYLYDCGLPQVNPKTIPNLNSSTSLKKLDLSGNNLNTLTLSLVLNVSKVLTHLNLWGNELEGSLPESFQSLCQLKELRLAGNNLSGQLNDNIQQLRCAQNGLELLLLDNNPFRKVSSTVGLDVSKNSLSFNLSSNWVPPFQLQTLYASSCILGPKFPTWIKHQRELMALDISNASISDSLPKWFWDQISSFYHLNVSHNKLSGTLPPKPRQRMKLEYYGMWDFSFNNLYGPLPPFPGLRNLVLSNNRFSGSLSSFCASYPLELTYLDLSSNLLEGPLSNCWGKFQNIEYLNLAKNKLSGRISKSFGTLQQMMSLHLNNNNFSGTLPEWLGHHMHHLIVLSLRANKFQGKLPINLCNLPFVQVLDLSQNNITGEISPCLNQINTFSDIQFLRKRISQNSPILEEIVDYGLFFEKATLAWKGEDMEYGKNLGLMTTIDLSCNHLTGDIPQSITKLVALAGLNLSRNKLTGFIPSKIGQMERLESLHLSRNYLYGRMPESFPNLSFLSYMDLSFNNLSGKIPLGTQLQSFDASTYIGNNGLCGPPLTNHCPGDATSSAKIPDKHATDEDKDKDELLTFGFYVSLGLGFCVGFWGVFGTLVMKASWRHAYFQFFNNMKDQIHVKIVVFTARMKGG